MSTTVAAFNNMLTGFLDELADVFPDQPDVARFRDGLPGLVAANARKPLELFMDAVAPHQARLMAKDASVFGELSLAGIDLGRLWATEDLSDNTRDAIWQYLHMLFVLGSTVLAVPPELLSGIESVAHSCADKIQAGDLDLSAVTQMLLGNNALAGMLASGEDASGLAGLLAGLGGGDK